MLNYSIRIRQIVTVAIFTVFSSSSVCPHLYLQGVESLTEGELGSDHSTSVLERLLEANLNSPARRKIEEITTK